MDNKISIIMSVHNSSETLEEAIESIINQTYTNWEFIICDDASSDKTYEILCKYKTSYPDKFILLKNEKNMYLAYSLNKCLKYARGEYIARMDGDDKSVSQRLEKQLTFLTNNPNVDLCGTAMQRFDEDGYGAIDYAPECPDKFTMHTSRPFCHATIMAKKKVFDELNGYTVAKRTIRGQDADLWYKFYSKGFIGENLQEPLYEVREDKNAIRRRTLRDRWMGLQTAVYGYRLLHYPWYYYFSLIKFPLKMVVPYKAYDILRKIQSKIQQVNK